MSVTPFMQAMLRPIMTNPFHQLSTWLKNDPTPFKTTHGITAWEYAASKPEYNKMMNDTMASDAQLVNTVVIERCKEMFNGLESLVDVGGGTGNHGKGQCFVFDLPLVVDGLQGGENLNYVGGDMFEKIPPTDAILLKVNSYITILLICALKLSCSLSVRTIKLLISFKWF